MMALQQHQTTKSICRVEDAVPSQRSLSQRQDPALLLARVMERQYGTLEVVSEAFWKTLSGRSRPYITMRCSSCSVVKDRLVENLTRGLITGCRCVPRKHQDRRAIPLLDRYYAMDGRCNNPNHPSYSSYGGRGIKNMFSSAQEYADYVLEYLPMPDYSMLHIDRIDNNGHYEPGNLRVVTAAQNCANTRRNVMAQFRGLSIPVRHFWHVLKALYPEFPYSHSTVERQIKNGHDPETMHLYVRPLPGGRRSTTSLMPDPDIVSLYLEKLSATATSG